MKTTIALFSLITASFSYGDIFSFHDVDGYEKCLQQDHLAERTDTKTGAQARMLDKFQIQDRCIANASKLIKEKKDKTLGMEMLKATKRESAPESSLDIIQSLVDIARPTCNEMAVYEVITKALTYPKDPKPGSYFGKAKKIVKVCIKDAEFKKDFTEEKDNANSYISENACDILKDEKVVTTCKKG